MIVASAGWSLIDEAWFQALEELRDISLCSDNTPDRIAASRAILEYVTNLGTSINPPHVPSVKPDTNRDDEEEEEDDSN